MSLLDKVHSVYKGALPDKSVFRNDPKAPCSIEDISKEFGSWDVFKSYTYPKFLVGLKKTAVATKPVAASVTKDKGAQKDVKK